MAAIRWLFVRVSVQVGRREKGSYEGELDVVASARRELWSPQHANRTDRHLRLSSRISELLPAHVRATPLGRSSRQILRRLELGVIAREAK